jgi:hypothetical protein
MSHRKTLRVMTNRIRKNERPRDFPHVFESKSRTEGIQPPDLANAYQIIASSAVWFIND